MVAVVSVGCTSDQEFLDREPTDILTQEQIFSDPELPVSILADLYNRYYDFAVLPDWWTVGDFNQAFYSNQGDYWRFQNAERGYGDWGTWDYGYVRHLNLFIERLQASEQLDEEAKNLLIAETRFLRASYYFTLVKRMGGVPLITESMVYDFSGDPTYLQTPRATEAEIYDFVIQEAEEIKDVLPIDSSIKARATKAAALAMQSRAALYAGSIAKYGATTPEVSLPGGEVGIPAERADEYYKIALEAAQAIIHGEAGSYSLYMKKPDDLSENFASIFYDKSNNPEAIFVEDYMLQSGKVHDFTIANQPRYGAEEEEGGRINPALNLVQSFQTIEGECKPLPIRDENGNFITYEEPENLFAGRDARLQGTVIVPGATFKGREVDIMAGILLPDGSIVSGDSRGQQKEFPGSDGQEKVVGFDGPVDGLEHTAQTGFYLRKYQDPKAGSGQRGVQSDVWFIRYRYAEVLLNAAEAAFELGQPALAAEYLNEVRERAGIITELTAADIDFQTIAHERYVELAFEGLYFFDLKRWRIAHEVLNGTPMTEQQLVEDVCDITDTDTQPYGLWPYKIHNPGSENDGDWVYDIVLPSRVTSAYRFRLGNYYSEIGQDVINNNPLIVRNPNQ